LFLNGNLQFSSRDEYRYHEALVHVGLGSLKSPKEVLVLGGGDGLAIREILKYPSVEKITLVDLDAAVTKLFSRQPALSKLNQQAFTSPKVQLVSADAMVWLRKNTRQYDFIVIDFPDPGNFSVGKLYTDTFYKTVKQALKPDGAMVVQSTSPFYAPKSFWCVVNTLDSVGLSTLPYHAYVPSFGDWGYILASHKAFLPVPEYPKGLKFVTPEMLPAMLTFPPDMRADTRAVNRLNNQVLVHTFESEWSRYVQEH
jgi:spermidine synthase